MGGLGIPLDVGTVTVASIALGLVVDDTIHFLDRYFEIGRKGSADVVDRLRRVFRKTGGPIFYTSLALVLGLGSFTVTSFRPTAYFGLLIALTSLFALLANLVLLPALLMVREDLRGRSAGSISGSGEPGPRGR
jgi:hypothetical protein